MFQGWLADSFAVPWEVTHQFPRKRKKSLQNLLQSKHSQEILENLRFFFLQNSSNVYFRTVFSASYNIYFYLLFIEKLIKPFLQYNLLFVQAVWPFLYSDFHTYENGQDFLDIQQGHVFYLSKLFINRFLYMIYVTNLSLIEVQLVSKD